MRSLRFDSSTFISEYRQALAAGMTSHELAQLMGITYSCFCCRKHALKKRGIRLPALSRKHGSGRRKAAKPVLRLMAPVAVSVEPAPLTFTIDVGVGHA